MEKFAPALDAGGSHPPSPFGLNIARSDAPTPPVDGLPPEDLRDLDDVVYQPLPLESLETIHVRIKKIGEISLLPYPIADEISEHE